MLENHFKKGLVFGKNSFRLLDEFANKYPQIKNAYKFAKKAHKGQKRKSGEDYFSHCQAVAEIICDWIQKEGKLKDKNIVSAALLHDVTEETQTKISLIEKEFGKDIAKLVDGVSKFKSEDSSLTDKKTRRKIVVKGYFNPRVFVLKLADRLHNMMTLDYLSRKKQIEKATETQDVYAPLAESLGMWETKTQLEDLSFKFLEPLSYRRIKNLVYNDQRLKISQKIKNKIENICSENKINSFVYLRRNGYWQIKKKLDENLSIDPDKIAIKKIDDLVSIRVLTDSNQKCYLLLGLIEGFFTDKIDTTGFDNYLIKPALNGYSALHTQLITNQGLIEIAITTFDKERYNKWGFLNYLKNSLLNNRQRFMLKLVFDEHEKIYFLPKKATGVDFAYLNPKIAPSAKKILINKKIYPLRKIIPNGSTLKIIYSKNPKRAPNKELILYASKANQKIIQRQIELLKKERIIQKGKKKLEKLLMPRGILALEDVKSYAWKLVYLTSSEDLEDLILRYMTSFLSKNEMDNLLNKIGLTKEKAKFSTLKVTGKNQPGILAKLTKLISEKGGDIRNLYQEIPGEKFMLRILIKNLENKNLDEIKKEIEKDNRFKSVLVV